MTGGGGPRWNDETQSWETEERRGYTPPPPPLPSVPPVVPGVPAVPVVPGPSGPPTPPGPPGPTPSGPPGAYNNITGTFVAGGATSFRERVTPLTAGLAVAVLAVGAATLWFTLGGGDRDGRQGAQGAGATSTEAAATGGRGTGGQETTRTDSPPPPDASASDSVSPSGTPEAGYTEADDEKGFTIAVPEEWDVRTEEGDGVFYKPAGGAELLQVFRVSEPSMTALRAVRAASDERSVNPGFEEVRIGAVENTGGGEAAELVYAYDSEETGGRRQVVERVFTASDGRLYAVLVAAPDTAWPRQEEILDVAVRHFDPYGNPF